MDRGKRGAPAPHGVSLIKLYVIISHIFTFYFQEGIF